MSIKIHLKPTFHPINYIHCHSFDFLLFSLMIDWKQLDLNSEWTCKQIHAMSVKVTHSYAEKSQGRMYAWGAEYVRFYVIHCGALVCVRMRFRAMRYDTFLCVTMHYDAFSVFVRKKIQILHILFELWPMQTTLNGQIHTNQHSLQHKLIVHRNVEWSGKSFLTICVWIDMEMVYNNLIENNGNITKSTWKIIIQLLHKRLLSTGENKNKINEKKCYD